MEGRELDLFGVKCGSCEKNKVTHLFPKRIGEFCERLYSTNKDTAPWTD